MTSWLCVVSPTTTPTTVELLLMKTEERCKSREKEQEVEEDDDAFNSYSSAESPSAASRVMITPPQLLCSWDPQPRTQLRIRWVGPF